MLTFFEKSLYFQVKRSYKRDMTLNIESLKINLSVSFFPAWQTGQQIQDIAERLGVSLSGGSSASGILLYTAQGRAIGQFRDAIESIGQHANFAK